MSRKCQLCAPGTRVSQTCNERHQTNCSPCPDGFFSSKAHSDTKCSRCSNCKRKERLVSNCTKKEDTLCECDGDYVYSKYEPCRKCSPHQIIVNNRCVNHRITTNAPAEGNGFIDGSTLKIVVPLAVILLVACTLVCLYRRCRRKQQTGGGTTTYTTVKAKQVDSECVVMSLERDNDYTPNPNDGPTPSEYATTFDMCGFSTDVENIFCKLCKKDFFLLAGKFSYTYEVTEQWWRKEFPVREMFSNLSGDCVSYGELYSNLIAIQRPDIVKQLRHVLPI